MKFSRQTTWFNIFFEVVFISLLLTSGINVATADLTITYIYSVCD
jgi:hypothetical protein